jgi:hypothetical protein
MLFLMPIETPLPMMNDPFVCVSFFLLQVWLILVRSKFAMRNESGLTYSGIAATQ